MALLEMLRRADIPAANIDDYPDAFDPDFPDDLRAAVVPDPIPGASRSAPSAADSPSTRSTRPTPARRPVSKQIKRQVADELEAYAQLASLAWSTRDEHCAGVLSDQSRAIAEALAEIIARNPRLLEWMHTSGLVGDWVKLAMALMPVVAAIRDHHIVQKVDEPAPGGVGSALDYGSYAPYRPAS